MAVVVVGALLYSTLALAVLAPTSVIERVGERLPGPLLVIIVTALGPVTLFADGIQAWPVVAASLVLITSCVGLARLTRRKAPETEWFAFWLLCAAVVWAGSPWLLVMLGI
jgi:hypothetical protein